MENADVARQLGEMADILELTGGNPFKVRAYPAAAQVVDTLPEPVADLWRRDALTTLPSIGAGIATEIGELLATGRSGKHDQLTQEVPLGILELLRLEGVGPRTVAAMWKELGITDLDGLEAALTDGSLRKLPRTGPVRIQSIRGALERYRGRGSRLPLHRAVFYADGMLARLRRAPGVIRAEAAGSLRRRRETVGDIDLLVCSERPWAAMRAFLSLPGVERVIAHGETKSSVRLQAGLQVDLRVLPPESWGAGLHYFTGSKAHNIAVRTRAVRRGLKLSEYGIFDRKDRRIGGATEEEVFCAVGLQWIPPELRENAGEIEAAEAGRLPVLVEERDVRGDLHVHSRASSDARAGIEELALEARRLGRRYLAITDHSRSRPLGLDPAGAGRVAAEVRRLDRVLGGRPRLLTGVEVDILRDGSLDLPLELLAGLDWVVASIHSHFHEPAEATTARILRAIRSGVVDVIGHPTGRQIGKRDPYPFDLAAVLEAAAEHGVALEINAMPDRLDLGDRACRLAREAGVQLVIDSDAHNASHLANLRYGVWVARRGWLEAKDVRNTRPIAELRRGRRKHQHVEAKR